MANQEVVEEIINSTDTVALVSKYISLTKRGKNYVGLCPFHTEKTPSFTVSPEKHLAKCFGCGKGGTVVDFVMDIENLDFKHALKYLADFNGMNVNLNIKEDETFKKNKKYYDIMELSVEYYKKVLHNTKEGLEAIKYLKNRGLNDEIIDEFNIGLSLDSKDNLYKVLTESGYLELDIKDVGLIDMGQNGYYDLFINRIMFPIYDEFNHPIAFSARRYLNEDPNEPKYINSKETIIFRKNENLFNLNKAKTEIRNKNRCILHEGQMDVIASYSSDLKEAFCSLGTAINKNVIPKIKKYTENIIICYDADKAGINASLKAIDLFLNYHFNISLVMLPRGMDPDEYKNKYSKEEYKKYFEQNIIPYYEYQYRVLFLGKDILDNAEKENIKKDAFKIISNLLSNTLQNDYLKRLSDDLGYNFESLNLDYNNYRNTFATRNYEYVENYQEFEPPVKKEPVPVKISDNYYSNCELRLIIYARSEKEKALMIDRLINDYMQYGMSNKVKLLWFRLINDYYLNYDYFDEGIFIKMLSQEEMTTYVNLIEKVRKDPTTYNDNDLNECILKIKEISYQKEIEDIARRMPKQDKEKQMKSLLKQYELKKSLKNLKEMRKK